MKIFKKLTLLFLISGLVLTGCKNNDEANIEGKPSKSLTIGSSYVYSSNDPHKDWNGWELVKIGVGETLFDLDNDYKLRGKLVSDYKNIDSHTWTFSLKDGVKFSNGKDVDGEAVVKSLERTIKENPEAKSLEGAKFSADGNTITMVTEDVNGKALNALVDPHFLICDIEGSDDIDSKPICTGPCKVESFSPESEIVLSKNENYWDGEPKLDKIVNTMVSESTTLGLALESGEVDIAQIDTATADKLEKDDNFTVSRIPSSRVYMIYLKEDNLSDIRLREGLFKAIDRKEIAKDLLNDGIEISYSPFSPDLDFGLKKEDVDTFDIDKSKEIAKSLDLSSDIILKFYERLNIPKISTQLQSQFTKAGYPVEAIQDENSKYVNTGDYDLGMYGVVTLRVGDPFDYIYQVFHTGGPANYNGYSNKKVDELIKKMKAEFDDGKRNDLSREILKTALADRLHYYIGNVKVDIAAGKNVKNFSPSPFEYKIIDVNTDIENESN